MSTRDEAVAAVVQALGGEAIIDPIPAGIAVDALTAEGWRKVPSRDELARAFWRGDDKSWNSPFDAAGRSNAYKLADTALALMDRGK